jgi:ABC-2 type transport system ATP-binding protein
LPDSIVPTNTIQIEQGKLEEFRGSVKSSLAFIPLRSTTRRIGGEHCRESGVLPYTYGAQTCRRESAIVGVHSAPGGAMEVNREMNIRRRSAEGGLAIRAEGLVRRFGDTIAVDGVDLEVAPGEIYGLLGPNGAGKTTTIRMFATLLRPDSGSARVFGHDVVGEADAVRGRVSLTGQFASVDEDLTGLENLVLIARLLGHSRKAARARASELLDAFGLTEAAGRQVKNYSGGMRRRLDIAASIVVTPDLIFLDEPTAGLDPRSRNQVWDIVRTLAAGGTTVLLTTQYLDEADQLADRIAVIDHGRVIAEGTPGELKASVGSGALHVRLRAPEQRPEAELVLSQTLGVSVHLESDPAALSARVSDPERVAHALAELSRSGVAITDFALGQPSLDEVFLALTGHPAEDHDATTTGEDAA